MANVNGNEVLNPEAVAAKVGLCLIDAHFALANCSEPEDTKLSDLRAQSGVKRDEF